MNDIENKSKLNINNIKNDIENYLFEDIEHKNKRIDYILVNEEKEEYIVIASDGLDEMIEFAPYTKELPNNYSKVPEWDYNFDTYLFEHLENGFEISFMEDEVHYGIWQAIEELYPSDMQFLNGFQKYLNYCYQNNISKEYLEKKLEFNYSDNNVPNIMKYYQNDYIEIVDDQVIMNKKTFNKISNGNINTLNFEKKSGTKHRLLENGMYILDLGYRDDTPVALIERTMKDKNTEYIIAFNYKIDDNKINWGYGYYYSNDIDKAKIDFNKVLDGGNLSDTFDKENQGNDLKEENKKKKKHREAR